MIRAIPRVTALLSAALTALIVVAAPAGAHAVANADGAAAAAPDGRTRVTLTIQHGCGDEPTTTFKVQIPAGATDVRPEDPAGWTSSILPDQVVWTGGSFPSEGSFSLELLLAQPAGTTVVMPAVQECPSGAEEAWIQPPNADGSEPASPAPTFVVPVNSTSPTTATTAATATPTTEDTPTDTARMAIEQTPVTLEGSDSNAAGLIVFIAVLAVIVGGATILFLRYRTKGNIGGGTGT